MLMFSLDKYCKLTLEKPVDETCTICLEGLQASRKFSLLTPCRHAFHLACLRRCDRPEGANGNPLCPLCRSGLPNLPGLDELEILSRHIDNTSDPLAWAWSALRGNRRNITHFSLFRFVMACIGKFANKERAHEIVHLKQEAKKLLVEAEADARFERRDCIPADIIYAGGVRRLRDIVERRADYMQKDTYRRAVHFKWVRELLLNGILVDDVENTLSNVKETIRLEAERLCEGEIRSFARDSEFMRNSLVAFHRMASFSETSPSYTNSDTDQKTTFWTTTLHGLSMGVHLNRERSLQFLDMAHRYLLKAAVNREIFWSKLPDLSQLQLVDMWIDECACRSDFYLQCEVMDRSRFSEEAVTCLYESLCHTTFRSFTMMALLRFQGLLVDAILKREVLNNEAFGLEIMAGVAKGKLKKILGNDPDFTGLPIVVQIERIKESIWKLAKWEAVSPTAEGRGLLNDARRLYQRLAPDPFA